MMRQPCHPQYEMHDVFLTLTSLDSQNLTILSQQDKSYLKHALHSQANSESNKSAGFSSDRF